MHAKRLVELAGWIAVNSPKVIDAAAPLPDDALSEYWIASRCRLDHWGRALRGLGGRGAGDEAPAGLLELAEEVLLADVLARVVAGVAIARDRRRGGDEGGPIGRNVLDAHREALSRLRAATFTWWAGDSPESRHARSLGRQAERWTDVLLAYVEPLAPGDRLAYDPARVSEFAHDCRHHKGATRDAAAQLIGFSLRASFGAATRGPVCGDLNRRVAGAALGLLGAGAFDGLGLPRSAYLLRAERITDEATALIDALFTPDFEARAAAAVAPRWRG